jgi:hypothetical protein
MLNFLSSETAPDPLYLCVWGRGNSWRAEVVSSSRGWGGGDSTQGETIWNSLGRQELKRRLLLIIHILWYRPLSTLTTPHSHVVIKGGGGRLKQWFYRGQQPLELFCARRRREVEGEKSEEVMKKVTARLMNTPPNTESQSSSRVSALPVLYICICVCLSSKKNTKYNKIINYKK